LRIEIRVCYNEHRLVKMMFGRLRGLAMRRRIVVHFGKINLLRGEDL